MELKVLWSAFLVEIDNLTRLCEKSNSKSNGNGESFGELSKQKQALQRERDALIEESTRLRSEMTNAEDRINGLEKESAEGKTDPRYQPMRELKLFIAPGQSTCIKNLF